MTNSSAAYSLVRFGVNSPDAMRLAAFYEEAFCAVVIENGRQDLGSLGALRVMLQLGDSILEILQFDAPGAAYPGGMSPYDLRFQHFAIVVADMPRAMQRLSQVCGWVSISTHGPQTLPQSAGGVAAFKFRDPDGHPLEFLQFAKSTAPAHWTHADATVLFSGIDHSAISVRNVDVSVRFYDSLGLSLTTRNLNEGIEQQRLDGVRDPHVDVIGLSPHRPTPHLELLHYRTPTAPPATLLARHDIAASRLIFSTGSAHAAGRGRLINDPDGHFLEISD